MNEAVSILDVLNNQKEKLPLLLGNGFSINIHDGFSYSKLIEEITKKCSPELKDLISKSQTKNTEDILFKLQNYIEISKIIKKESNEVEKLFNEMKKYFITVISDIHPKPGYYSSFFNEIHTEIDLFSQIYTTNYDLSLYYLSVGLDSFTDKFGRGDYLNILTFDPENHKTYKKAIYYLHGNLMFFTETNEVTRTTKLETRNGYPLLEQISSKIENDKYPIIVTEGSSNYKLDKINMNEYLKYCWEILQEESSKELVIYGHSLSETDNHIIKLIEDKFDKIYYGLFSVSSKNKSRIRSLFDSVEVVFFNSNEIFQDKLPF